MPRLEVAEHVMCRLQEILERCGVQPISDEGDFDRNRHQSAGKALAGATVAETLSPGFQVGVRILRRARVQVKNPAAPDFQG
jgi:molecular chaperone GrpE (heat shock protein)